MDLLDLVCSEFEELAAKQSSVGIDVQDIGEISRLIVDAETAIGRFSAQGFVSPEDAKILFGMLDALRNAMAASKRRAKVVREFNELVRRKESDTTVDAQLKNLQESLETIAAIVASQLAALDNAVEAALKISDAPSSTYGR